LLAREGRDVTVTRGSTYENRVNLAPGFFDQIIRKYEGTRLGRQELNAELLEDTPGALWNHAIIDATRQAAAPHLARIVVAIDPAADLG
jgi:phage terminase large subunit-like protein